MYPTNLRKQKTKNFTSRSPVSGDDIISTLPNEILHYIMTFLPTKFATRTSVLSKKFNSVWWSFPTISLVENDHFMFAFNNNLGEGPYTRNKFLEHMNLCYMRHDLKFLEKLTILANEPINARAQNNISHLIDSFFFAAVEGAALKEIDLRFPTTDEPPLPDLINHDLFYGSFYMMPEIPLFTWCKYLRSLKLQGCSFREFEDMVPDIKLPFVKVVYIRNCLMSNKFLTSLIHGCPQLEELSFKFCLDVKVITFSHSKMRTLILGCYDTSIVFQIDVPNLQTFMFRAAYWQHVLADPFSEVILKPEHIIDAPNLETFLVKYACVDRMSIQRALVKFQNLKEMTLTHCIMEKAPKFWGDKLERLVIANCEFGGGGLLLSELNLPILRSLSMYSCKGLEWLSIKSTTLEELILKEFTGLEEWAISAPTISSYRCINLARNHRG